MSADSDASLTAPEAGGEARVDVTGRDRMARNVMAAWASQVVFVIAGFIMPRMIDQHIGQEALGIWDFGWSLMAYFRLLLGGVISSVNRYVAYYRAAGDLAGMNQAVSSVSCVFLVMAGVVLLLTVAVVMAIPNLLSSQLGAYVDDARWTVLLLGTALAIQVEFSSFAGVLTGHHRWDLHNAILAGGYAATVVGMITCLLLGGGLRCLALVTLCGEVANRMVSRFAAYRVCPSLSIHLRQARWSTAREMITFGGKTFATAVAWTLTSQGVRILIVAFLGPTAVALFSRPMSLVTQAKTFVERFSIVLTPTASSLQAGGKSRELRDFLISSVRYTTYVALPMVVTMAIMGDPLLLLWMGPRYQTGMLLAVLALGEFALISQGSALTVLAGMNAHGRPGLVNLLGAILAIGMVAVVLGLLGGDLVSVALAATVPPTIAMGLYLPIYACRVLSISLWEYTRRTLCGPVLCVAPYALCLAATRLVFADRPYVALMIGLFAGGIVLGPLYWRYVLPASTKRRLAERLHQVRRLIKAEPGPDRRSEDSAAVHRADRRSRRLALDLLRAAGAMHLWRFLHRRDVAVLVVHGVMDKREGQAWTPNRPRLSPHRLEEHVRALSKHYHFVSLEEAADMIAGRKPIRNYSLVFTFDDGYRNNLTEALPVLRRYNAPATFFIATGHVEHRHPFWFDRLDYALAHAPGTDCGIQVGPIAVRAGAAGPTARDRIRTALAASEALGLPDEQFRSEVDRASHTLEAASGRRLADILEMDEWSRVLTWEEVEQAAGDGVSFGSHTVDHLRLRLANDETVCHQLLWSRRAIEQHTGRPCVSLAYPNGSFSDQTVRLAAESGYTCAVTTLAGLNCPGDDVMVLRRISIAADLDPTGLLAWTCGLLPALSRVKSWLRLSSLEAPLPRADLPEAAEDPSGS